MSEPALVLFDDAQLNPSAAQLSPLTDLRASFDLRTGVFTTLERLSRRLTSPAALHVPTWLQGVAQERHPSIPVNNLDALRSSNNSGGVMLINGRAPLAHRTCGSLLQGQCITASGSTPSLVAGWMSLPQATAFLSGTPISELGLRDVSQGAFAPKEQILASSPTAVLIGTPLASPHPSPTLMTRPWHIRTLRDACLSEDLRIEVKHLLNTRDYPQLTVGTLCMGTEPFYVDPTATILPGVVLDFSNGPIWIDEQAVIRPGAVLTGPCYIGQYSHVLDRAVIRANTSIGPWCKVAGEIGGTIFQGFANKAHDGYLGDSYIGEWVNLGAGTTNSNLLNTYGEIVARPFIEPSPHRFQQGSNERTGETFLGCTLGDHVKTAICTRIMTGSIIGTGTMFAASSALSGTVLPFSWCTDAGVKPYRFDKFMEVARAAMSRRKITPSDAYAARLQQLCTG